MFNRNELWKFDNPVRILQARIGSSARKIGNIASNTHILTRGCLVCNFTRGGNSYEGVVCNLTRGCVVYNYTRRWFGIQICKGVV